MTERNNVSECNDWLLSIKDILVDQRIPRLRVCCTQSAGDAVVIDKNKTITVSMWEEQFDKIEGNIFFQFTDSKLFIFNEERLPTQHFIEMKNIKPFEVFVGKIWSCSTQ